MLISVAANVGHSQHNIHNADAPHQKGDGGHRRQQEGQGARGFGRRFHDLREVHDGEVLLLVKAEPVALGEKRVDLVDGRRHE